MIERSRSLDSESDLTLEPSCYSQSKKAIWINAKFRVQARTLSKHDFELYGQPGTRKRWPFNYLAIRTVCRESRGPEKNWQTENANGGNVCMASAEVRRERPANGARFHDFPASESMLATTELAEGVSA